MIGRCVDMVGGKNAAQRILTRLRKREQNESASPRCSCICRCFCFVVVFVFGNVRMRFLRSCAFAAFACVRGRIAIITWRSCVARGKLC